MNSVVPRAPAVRNFLGNLPRQLYGAGAYDTNVAICNTEKYQIAINQTLKSRLVQSSTARRYV